MSEKPYTTEFERLRAMHPLAADIFGACVENRYALAAESAVAEPDLAARRAAILKAANATRTAEIEQHEREGRGTLAAIMRQTHAIELRRELNNITQIEDQMAAIENAIAAENSTPQGT